ncbi:DUF4912 domain-containing protein [Bacillus sp. FJAT-29814]|uniref:DUF4912 domain-containing protein n=1 Tax=Bacillus sp. FJAT-29814 TaxID=1729688 RepID=UPI000836DA15|nr:DUF4912 domain-containing protein [Bacillus sp. FJAT-29814]
MIKQDLFTPIKGELIAKLVAPQKMFLFWDPSQLPKMIIQLYFNQPIEELVSVIRVFDVTDILFNGKNAHHYYEISIPYPNSHWVVKGLTANRSYLAELGVYLPETGFFPIFRSNCIQTPAMAIPDGTSFYGDYLQLKRHEESPPKWRNYVSTYSYYEVPENMEEKNA